MRNITWIFCWIIFININCFGKTGLKSDFPLPVITTDTGVIVLTTHDPWQMGCDVQCGGTITDDGGLPILEYGVCWSSNPEPTVSDNHTFNCWGTPSFDCYISEWELGWFDCWQPLLFRAYATNDSGTYYGDEKTLFMMPVDIYIYYLIIDLNPTSITFQREIVTNGYPFIIYNCQSTLFPPGNPVCNNDCWNSIQICQIENLEPSTDYYISTIAETGCSGCYQTYMNDLYFTTLPPELAVVKTLPAISETDTSATFGGNVLDAGTDLVISRGIYYGTLPAPETNGTRVPVGSDLGQFSTTITGLVQNTIYYVKAYATSSYGTSYGDEVSFTSGINIDAHSGNQLFGVTTQGAIDGLGMIFHIDHDNGIHTLDFSMPLSIKGYNPNAEMTEGGNGKLYGMTTYGGENSIGVIFEWDPVTNIGVTKIDFDGTTKGSYPNGSMTLLNGKFYGLTSGGGLNSYGVIFEWDPVTNIFTKKIDFNGIEKGSTPQGSLTISQGKLYGMTTNGGTNGKGVIFEWDPSNNIFIKKIDFDGVEKGQNPYGSLTFEDGKFYGMTNGGGTNNKGVIFEWDPASNTYIKRIDLNATITGSNPRGCLTINNGKFYGMTTYVGIYNGGGVIFEWDPATNIFTKKIVFDGAVKGSNPFGSLTFEGGKFYGMTCYGGAYSKGVLFSWDPTTNIYNKIINFNGNLQGSYPNGSLTLHAGKLFGMTKDGGVDNKGIIFEYDPAYSNNGFKKKIDFNYSSIGRTPQGCLALYEDKFYGMTENGGLNDLGVIFEWDPVTDAYTKKFDFDGTANGNWPKGSLTHYNGKLYGMTSGGGANAIGAIFEYDLTTDTYTKKIDFNSTTMGRSPWGSLTFMNGKFYGLTSAGGANDYGVIFEWDPATNIFTKKVDFDGTTMGRNPYGSLNLESGKFYGMTSSGGTNNMGVIFEWDPATNVFTKKIDFDGSAKGRNPYGSLTAKGGKFYGMAETGGAYDLGVIFEWDPVSNSFNKKIDFDGIIKGSYPNGSLTLSDGKFFGMTSRGGSYGDKGVVFLWDLTDNTYIKLLTFKDENGSKPMYTQFAPYIVDVPTIQASNISFTDMQNNQITINWTDGNGTNRAVFIKQDNAGIAKPANNTTYFAGTVFGSGTQIGTTGWYCVFNGNAHEAGLTVTNLLRNTNYQVMVCEYKGIPGTEQYNISTSVDNPNVYKIIVPAPVTTVPLITAITNSPIHVPVTVTGFDTISAFTLRLEYDPAVISYTGYSNVNSSFGGIIVNNLPINSSLHRVMMLWSNVTPVTLPPNSKLLDLDFTYLSDTTALTWNNTANGGSDCEYADATGEPLTDIPTSQYYINGVVNWLPTYQVSGIIKYNNSTNIPLDLVEVQLVEDSVALDTVFSNVTGYYEFSQLADGVYQGLLNTGKPWGGVNATDALKVERHVVGLEPLTEPVRLMAADVNNSGSINATDALKIKRRVVGFDNSFTRGDWTFAKPVVGGDTILVYGSDVIQDFYGLCVGDVNGSNNPGPGAKSTNSYEIEYIGEIAAIPGTTIKLPVRIDRAADISAITMVLQLSPGLFQVQGVEIAIGTAIFNQTGDELRIAWSEISGLNLNAGDTLLSLELLVNETPNIPGAIPLWLMDGCELADMKADPIEEMTFIVPGIDQTVSIEEITDPGFSIYPNPASDKVIISFVLRRASHAECYLTDVAGRKLIEAYNRDFRLGQQTQLIDISNLKPGVYLVCQKVDNNGGLNQMQCKRLVIL